MSQFIGSGQNNRFDVKIQEHVLKVQNPGGIFEKKCVLGVVRLVAWPFLHKS